MSEVFRFVDPIDGHEIVAEMTTEIEHNVRASRKLPDGKPATPFVFLLEVTQWSFFGSRSIVVAQDVTTGKTWAFPILAEYDDIIVARAAG